MTDPATREPDTREDDPHEETRAGLRDTLDVVRVGIRGLYRSRLPQMGAALAFRTLFALIPILVISVAIVGAFADREDVKAVLDKALQNFGVSEIAISDPDAAVTTDNGDPFAVGEQPDPESGPEARPEAALEAAQADQDQTAESDEAEVTRLQETLTKLIDGILEVPFKAIGAAGLLTLIYAAISMLTEIERAFNHVYRAKIGRSWGRRITQYWTILTLGAILIFATFYTSEQFRGLGVGIIGFVVGIAITALFLLLAYTMIPNTRVHVRAAAVGGLVAAVMWEAAKWGFRQYLDYSVSYASLYGSLGVLPLFMLWIYLTWVIALFGLSVSYGLQHLSGARELAQRDEDDERITDPAVVLPLLAIIGENFTRGRATDTRRIADELGIPGTTAASLVERLNNTDVLHKLDGGDDRYTLARPPERIQLDQALLAAHDLAHPVHTGSDARGDDWASVLGRVRDAEREALTGVSLADLLSERANARMKTRDAT